MPTHALRQTASLLARDNLELKEAKTRVADFESGFRFLGAYFQGDAIWVPWKHARAQGRILFMAPPMPISRRARYEMAPPKGTMQAALERGGTTMAGTAAAAAVAMERRSEAVAYLYLSEQGAVLRKAGDRFLVEKDDEVLLDLPYHKLDTVLLFGNVQVTTQALGELLEKGVNLSLFSRQGHYRGSLAPPRGHHVEMRVAQFEWYRDGSKAIEVARRVVAGKIANGLAVLARYRSNHEVTAEWEQRRAEIAGASETCAGAKTVAELDGVEGAAARAYFGCVMAFNTSGMEWPGREASGDGPLNALLSLAYTLVMND